MLDDNQKVQQAALMFGLALDELLGSTAWRVDPQMEHTAQRWARMMRREACAGMFEPRPEMTSFPNTKHLDEFYVVGPIALQSVCAHHLVPVQGRAWIGVLPGARLLGLSKFTRLARWVFARPTQQEDATVMLADELEEEIAPRGLGVIVRATHLCMTWRGVRDHAAQMQTVVLRGALRDNVGLRAEFLHSVPGG